jgi:hypothetical protein
MKKILPVFTIASSLVLGMTNAYADDAAAQYMQSLTIFLPTLQKNADTIWPGFRVDTKPLIMTTHANQEGQGDDSLYALNFAPQNPAWQKQVKHDSVGVHDYRPSINAPYFTLENQQAMVFHFENIYTDQEKSNAWMNQILAMDYYSYYEFLNSPNAEAKLALVEQQDMVHDGFNKPDSFSLLFLQEAALKDYLETRNEESLKNYAALFQSRYQSLDKNSQIVEVIAGEPLVEDYVGIKALAKNDTDFAVQVMREYTELPPVGYADYISEDYLQVLKFIHLAVELGLDNVQPTWKAAVEASNTPPSMLLQQHYHFSDKEVAARVQMAKTQYGYADISKSVNDLLTPYLKEMQALQAQYQQSAGVELVLNLPEHRSESQGTPLKQYAIDSRVKLHTAAAKLSISSHDGHLNFDGKNVPLYFMNSNDSVANDTSVMKFKIPAATKFVVDGKEDTVEHFVVSNKSVEFHQLSIAGGGQDTLSIDLNVNAPGYTLVVVDGQVQMVLPKEEQKR